MVKKDELVIFTERNMVYFILERGYVMFNDTGKNLLVREVVVVFPCGEIFKSSFENLPYMGGVSIVDFKPVIKDRTLEKGSRTLNETIKTHSGFILPVSEAYKVFSGSFDGWCLEGGILRNKNSPLGIPRTVIEHLKRIPEISDLLELRAMKEKAPFN